MASGPLLAIDTSSSIVSVAVGRPGESAELHVPQGRSSRELIAMIDELLGGIGARARDLVGLGAARGPGSFTGLRVGLGTALGLHLATGVPAGALSTLELLATYVGNEGISADSVVLAVVDAHHGRWFAQPFRILRGSGEVESSAPPRILDRTDLERSAERLVGFGVGQLVSADRAVEPQPLANTLLGRLASGTVPFDQATLTEPLYLRSPATSPSARLPGAPRARRPRASAPRVG